eukprot:1817538-Amphidinium_carterae.2
MVAGLTESVTPSVPGKTTDFVKSAFNRLPYFARITVPTKVKAENRTEQVAEHTLVGKDAVEHQWQQFKKQKDAVDLN